MVYYGKYEQLFTVNIFLRKKYLVYQNDSKAPEITALVISAVTSGAGGAAGCRC